MNNEMRELFNEIGKISEKSENYKYASSVGRVVEAMFDDLKTGDSISRLQIASVASEISKMENILDFARKHLEMINDVSSKKN